MAGERDLNCYYKSISYKSIKTITHHNTHHEIFTRNIFRCFFYLEYSIAVSLCLLIVFIPVFCVTGYLFSLKPLTFWPVLRFIVLENTAAVNLGN